MKQREKVKGFYSSEAYINKAKESVAHRGLDRKLIQKNGIIVELGCGIGVYQDISAQYIGLDISHQALKSVKNGICCDISEIPLKSQSVTTIFSSATLEHIPAPEKVLNECIRILKPGGIVIHSDAWLCGLWASWAARGISRKKWVDCNLKEKILKMSMVVRGSPYFRSLYIIPSRILREIRYLLYKDSLFKLDYKKLTPNLNEILGGDADAFASIDSHAVILFYKSRGLIPLRPKSFVARIFHKRIIICQKQYD